MLVTSATALLIVHRGILSLAAPTGDLAERTSAASGTFNVLSMNVAGLPEILNGNGESGDKIANTMLIGQDFAKYNYSIIHVQEISGIDAQGDTIVQAFVARTSTIMLRCINMIPTRIERLLPAVYHLARVSTLYPITHGSALLESNGALAAMPLKAVV
ncbi:hypothetical protein FS749_008340 [Ceratobasidium sp. UAMH 11750]|nr:hypothetical protein FS749_008340 [Ceratobasidium sp. UAMH 11750]